MVLELNDKECEVLTRIVDSYLPDMRAEIASGGPFSWRIEMKAEEVLVKNIIGKLHDLKGEFKKAA